MSPPSWHSRPPATLAGSKSYASPSGSRAHWGLQDHVTVLGALQDECGPTKKRRVAAGPSFKYPDTMEQEQDSVDYAHRMFSSAHVEAGAMHVGLPAMQHATGGPEPMEHQMSAPGASTL